MIQDEKSPLVDVTQPEKIKRNINLLVERPLALLRALVAEDEKLLVGLPQQGVDVLRCLRPDVSLIVGLVRPHPSLLCRAPRPPDDRYANAVNIWFVLLRDAPPNIPSKTGTHADISKRGRVGRGVSRAKL